MESIAAKRPLEEDVEAKENLLNLKGTQFLPTPTPTTGSISSDVATDCKHSPAPSESELSSIQDVSSIGPHEGSTRPHPQALAGDAPPAKRRKLTPGEKAERDAHRHAERELKRQQQEVKKQEQAELKARRDEEKHVRDVQKQKRAEEREAKKREKELEDERKTQEKIKKERSQMRLGAFFQPPPSAGTGSDTPSGDVQTRRRSLSLESYGASEARHTTRTSTVDASLQPQTKSDYTTYFLPFELRPHTTLHTRPTMSVEEMTSAQDSFDRELDRKTNGEEHDLGLNATYPDIRASFVKDARRLCRLTTIRHLHQAAGSSTTPSTKPTITTKDILAELSSIPIRYIHFHEDVRPPFVGTYTSVTCRDTARKMRTRPFLRCRTDTRYDYDSEAEWEEPEEGEDLENEDEDDESVDDEQEMDGFLDDENDELASRRKITLSDLEPHSTGVCWQNPKGGYTDTAALNHKDRRLLGSLRLQILLPGLSQTSIDPFSTAYWQVSKPAEPPQVLQDGAMRPPLAERCGNTPSKLPDPAWPIVDKEAKKRAPKTGSQKTMTADEFEVFKQAVVGSLMSKQELVTKLKTSFPKFVSSLIKDTLSERFAQIGKSKADKKWVYVDAT